MSLTNVFFVFLLLLFCFYLVYNNLTDIDIDFTNTTIQLL